MDSNVYQIIGYLLTFFAAVIATRVQQRKNRADDKRELEKLQESIETTLWDRVKEEIDSLTIENRVMKEEIKQLKKLLMMRDERIDKQDETISELKKQLDESHDENDELRIRLRDLEQRMGTGPLGKEKES